MIQFFEMLNECSPLRTVAYLLSVLAFTFIVFAGITDIIKSLRKGPIDKKDKDE